MRSGGRKPPLRRIHESVYDQNGDARKSLEYHRTRMTEDLVESLRPGPRALSPLIVRRDGRVYQDNTRIKVLEERGYPVNDLPREILE
jgi:hypothetical protein